MHRPFSSRFFCVLACEDGDLDSHVFCCVCVFVCLCVGSYGAVVRTLAGGLNGTVAAFGDGTGSLAGFNRPHGVAVDASGNMFVADRFNHRVRKVTPGGGTSNVSGLLIVCRNLKHACVSLATMRTSGTGTGRVEGVWRSDRNIPLNRGCRTIDAMHCDNINCLVLGVCCPIAQWSLRLPEVAYQVISMQLVFKPVSTSRLTWPSTPVAMSTSLITITIAFARLILLEVRTHLFTWHVCSCLACRTVTNMFAFMRSFLAVDGEHRKRVES